MEDRTIFNTIAKPTWCPGCGNFGIQAAIKKALLDLGLKPHQVVISSGIGCSGKIPHWIQTYGIHGLHGRALPVAQGLKLANQKMVVIAEGGDGDGYDEGMCHFINGCKRNMDITYLVHNNGVFGLTTGQVSPTGNKGFVSSTTPYGSPEPPISPPALAIVSGATFVARGFSGDVDHLASLIAAGIKHKGFSHIDILQVCVSFNPSKSYKWYQERVYKLETQNWDSKNKIKAIELALTNGDKLPIGIFYQVEQPTFEDQLPQLAKRPLVDQDISNIDVNNLMDEAI